MGFDLTDSVITHFPHRETPCPYCGSTVVISGWKKVSNIVKFCDRDCERAYDRKLFREAMEAMPEAPFGMFSLVDLIKAKGFRSAPEADALKGINPWRFLREKRHLTWLQADRAAVQCGLHPGVVWGAKWWSEAGVCLKCGTELRQKRCHTCDAARSARRKDKIREYGKRSKERRSRGECEVCGRFCSGAQNDRLRRGLCETDYRRWVYAGRPEDFVAEPA